MTVSRPAGFLSRLGANIVDGLLITVVWVIISYIVYQEFTAGDLIQNILQAVYAVVVPALWYGYSVGKYAFGIRIARIDGKKVGIGTMLMRVFGAGIVYALTLGIALLASVIMVLVRKDRRAVHDFIAGTYVTHEPPEMKKSAE
ncbi:RDD family protein [Bacillus daqingensis]|uniref:RDD family protein n=1 Tax=Bacillus daqingensis TaxID=872396 RepID=A0ABV9NWQ3_9BACI